MSATLLSPVDHLPSGKLLPAVEKLLRLRWQIWVNSFRHSKLLKKVLIILGLVTLLGVAVVMFWLSWLLLRFLRSPLPQQYLGIDPTPFIQTVPVLIFAGLFLGILIASFGVLLQALYLSGDMDFLLSSPVPIRAVFVTKLLQAVLPNFGLVVLFGLPVLFGLGAAGGYNLLYYPLVLVTMVAMTLAAAGLSALLVMLVVRVMPPRRAAEILGFIAATFGIICSQMGNIYNVFGSDADISQEQVSRVIIYPDALQCSLDAVELGWSRPGRTGRGPLGDREPAGDAQPGAFGAASSGSPWSRRSACITPVGLGCR